MRFTPFPARRAGSPGGSEAADATLEARFRPGRPGAAWSDHERPRSARPLRGSPAAGTPPAAPARRGPRPGGDGPRRGRGLGGRRGRGPGRAGGAEGAQGPRAGGARWWKPAGEGRVRCVLCPFECEIAEGERGACKARANVGGTLRCLTYGRPVAAHDDPIEKKPLFHFLPGAHALSIATIGCNLGCVFCQNWEISQSFPESRAYGEEVPPERIVGMALERDIETIAFTYTEPTVFFEYMVDVARAAREAGLRTLWITCGYINPEPLAELCAVLDAANVDLKGFDEAFYRTYCQATLPPVLRTLETLRKNGVWVEVTNLVIPGANDDPETIRRMCSWMRRALGEEVPLHFSRFHPDYRLEDRPATPPATLEAARRVAREEGLKHVYIGNLSTPDGETTFCPRCGRPVVVREGFWVRETRLEGGRCASCMSPVAGVWK
ncbi:MAG: AmmeMemoRadiSam system radical SAM enzyme [Planctomycetes bacterium]|nr:AmmeMemoRadiSam system radical SAM enzyme [Planctomycetota bacterium]